MATTADMNHRTQLPVPDRVPPGMTTFDAKDPDTHYPPIAQIRPPDGAPNVVVIMTDDTGFGASSIFGGPCRTPNAERLAQHGLRYTRFHTTALCSPTRAALLSGRNHHTVGMGGITEAATAAPGQNSVRPNTCAPLPEVLRLNGYSTAQFGKCHEVPVWETSPSGPFDRWPTPGGGFEHFYGFIGGETNQYYPALYDGTSAVDPPKTPEQGYHLTEDLADKAIGYMRQQRSLTPDKPFFLYFAPGATHAPHHVPAEWSGRYTGAFDDGWDALRERTFERQKEIGVVPADADLTARSEGIPAWADTDDALKPVLARQMEIYAGFLEHTDHHIGRVLDALDELGVAENTLVYYIIGDNGASAEGSLQGTFNEMVTLTGFGALETSEFMASHAEQFGTPQAYNHYAVGWAHAMNTPYQWTKQVASHWGGTRNGTIVSWPAGITAAGEDRHQFTHVIDIAATVLEAAGLPEPMTVHGVQQLPLEGTSMLYSFADADAPERHQTQYFEMVGNRGIYHKGWTAVTKHRTPWETGDAPLPDFDDDVWELYDTSTDWTQAHDIADKHPDRLHTLQRLWLIEAAKHNALPLDDRFAERANPDIAGRPQLVSGTRQRLYEGMGRLNENSVISLKNKSHIITAHVEVPEGGANGVIIAQGGMVGGWSLYVRDGILKYCYNFYNLQRYYVAADTTLTAGVHDVIADFAYDGGGLAKGGQLTLFVDGVQVGTGRIEQTEPIMFAADETCDLGRDAGSAVTDDYPPGGDRFTGHVHWVDLDTSHAGEHPDSDGEHRHRLHVALGTQ
jgi:arylsulfatase A-like enzyme